MQGGIFTRQRCPVCGGKMPYDANRRPSNCYCEKHTNIAATGEFIVYFGADHQTQWPQIGLAEQQLGLLRGQLYNNQYDPRDWKQAKPLGLVALRNAWIKKKKSIKPPLEPSRINDLENDTQRAINIWGNINIKEVTETPHIDDFISFDHRWIKDPEKRLSDNKIHQMCANLQEFLRFGAKVARVDPVEFEFPGFEYNETETIPIIKQLEILDWLKDHCPEPRIVFAFESLCRNPKVRPGEFCAIKWGHIDPFNGGNIYVHKRKNRRKKGRRNLPPKLILISPEQHGYLNSIEWGDPDELFMTYTVGRSGVTPGDPIHPKVLNKWVKKAGLKVGVETTLYAATKHTTTTGLNRYLDRETIRRGGTGHATRGAYEDYQHDNISDQLRVQQATDKMYRDARKKISVVKDTGPAQDILTGSGDIK